MLEALAERRMFIVYRAADKVPVDPTTLENLDAQLPANWMLPAVADAWVKVLGPQYGVGIVLHEGCGLWCLDLDKCLMPDNTWAPHAAELCQRFAGAAIEVSLSGRGLHIFGSHADPMPAHGTRSKAIGAELYTDRRYIALTGVGFSGDPRCSFNGTLDGLIAQHFPLSPTTLSPGGWTSDAVPTYTGPFDDEELIAIALKSKSAAAVFGEACSFADLWDANAAALSVAYPSNQGNPYDASAADQALANHLAWYTGGNCDRVLQLMGKSKLAREKWNRDDYIQGTVSKAVAWTKTHYRSRAAANHAAVPAPPQAVVASAAPVVALDRPVGIPAPPETPDSVSADYQPFPGEAWNMQLMLQRWDGYVYIEDINAIFLPPPMAWTLTKERFDIRHGGYLFQITHDGQNPTESAWDAFTNSHCHRWPRADGMYFEPRQQPGKTMTVDGRTVVNSWMPMDILTTPGDPKPFIEHVRKCFPIGDDAMILIYYFAACVQFKGVKSKWAPLIQGVEGNGKSLLSAVMKYCLGYRYVHDAKASQIDAKFNASFYQKLLIVVEEIQIGEERAAMWEALKTMITETRMAIEAKGVDSVSREVCHNFIFNSNHKDAIRKSGNDRRIAPFFAAQQTVDDLLRDGMLDDDGNSKYFDALFDWLDSGGYAVTAHYLSTLQIPDRYNFAKRCRRAPRTSSTPQSIEVSLGAAEQEILEAAAQGVDGFANGWVNSQSLDHLLDRTGKSKYLSRSKRHEMLSMLGYIRHPGLPEGRVTLPIAGARPRLYIKRGHLSSPLLGPDVTAAYLAAQKVSR
jgi:Family of unknown function (DUF5906)